MLKFIVNLCIMDCDLFTVFWAEFGSLGEPMEIIKRANTAHARKRGAIMDKGNTGMLRGTGGFRGLRINIEGVSSAVRGLTAGGVGRARVVAVLAIFLSGMGPAVYAQEATFSGNETISFNADVVGPIDSTEALMDAYNKKIQSVMDQADPFYAKNLAEVYSAAESLKNSKEYTKALELADEALARYKKQYEAMLIKAKAYKTLDQILEVRIMIEQALETLGEGGTNIDSAVMALYKEIMQKTSGNPDVEMP